MNERERHIEDARLWEQDEFNDCEHVWQYQLFLHRAMGGEYSTVERFCHKCGAYKQVSLGYRVMLDMENQLRAGDVFCAEVATRSQE